MILRKPSYRRIPGWAIRGLLCICFLLGARAIQAGPAAFDLVGPSLEVNVTRADKTLPIADVASLQSGDRIWIHPDLTRNHQREEGIE